MIIGIDPGVKGGMALLNDRGSVIETVPFEGAREDDIVLSLNAWIELCDHCRPVVYLEKVGFIAGDGGKGAFTFGQVYGFLRGMVKASRLELKDVYPMKWMSCLGCLTGGNKNISKNRAIEMFPDYHAARPRGITHGIADALLIAEYGRLQEERLYGGR